MPRHARLSRTAALALLAAASPALAQGVTGGAVTRTPNTAAIAPVSTDKIEIWPEARPILEREHDKLREIKSLIGSSTSKWEYTVENQPDVTQEFVSQYWIQKPDKLKLVAKNVTVIFDGSTLTVHAPALKQYIQTDAALWTLRDLVAELSEGQVRSIPGEAILRPGITLEASLRNFKSAETVRHGDVDGRPGLWISGTAVDDRQPTTTPYTFERWFSNADGLTYAFRQDFTRIYQELADRYHAEQNEGQMNPAPTPKVVGARWTTSFQRQVDAPIPDGTFIFTPPEGHIKVGSLLFPRPNLQQQLDLIGTPAAGILQAKDLTGAGVDPEAVKDKVIVLDFWATWCGPCIQAMPHFQQLSLEFGEKKAPIVIFGVNGDTAASAARVRRFLSKNKFIFPQIDDSAGNLAKQYHVNGIPCTVIIDAKGVVQDIDVGYLPGKETKIREKILRVIAGETLHSPEALAQLKRQAQLLATPAPN